MKRSVFWPCGDCRLNCSKNAVQCDSCNSWYHYHCQLLSLSDVEFLVNGKDSNFSCLNCLKEEIGATYSFSSGLLRLHTVTFNFYTLYFICKLHFHLHFKLKFFFIKYYFPFLFLISYPGTVHVLTVDLVDNRVIVKYQLNQQS